MSNQFATTRWSIVLAARNQGAPEAQQALADLCEAYWYPLYAFIRRQGHNAEEAQDLTQEFFGRLLEKDFLASVAQGKGRFRSFLLACCRHFLSNERDRARTKKRGGGQQVVSIDFGQSEERFSRVPSDSLTAERLYERQWTLALLDRVLSSLQQEYSGAGKGSLFDQLRFTLTGSEQLPYRELTEALGMTESAIKVTVHRMRRRYRDLLRSEIAQTVEEPSQIDEEIQILFRALSPD